MVPGDYRMLLLNKQHELCLPDAGRSRHLDLCDGNSGKGSNKNKVSKAAASPTSVCSCDGTCAKGFYGSSPTGARAIAWQGRS